MSYIQKRTPANTRSTKKVGTGPYLARIVNHLDPSFMGSLEVTLLREQANAIGEDRQTFIVKCAMPFFGYTAFEFMGQNSADNSSTLDAYNDTQKSYGMWFVPPDIGITVLVVFVDGDPSQGYWIGCIPSNFSNHMVPAIGGSKLADLDQEDKKKYNTTQPLPVAEINRRLNTKNNQGINPENIKKPVHPIADRFLEQGLLDDDIRGTTTTTSRREVPSMVFGISTPGPRDKRPKAKRAPIGTRASQTGPVPVSRLGGTQFVMDDGDERYVRATPASEGPIKYVDLINGVDLGTGQKTNEKGDLTIPYNEYFRIRTRTGHQLLMHNSEDLIYIGNSRGTSWIELTSNGKIDIFSEDSISIHTKNDLNIRADRDINMEAGRNINMKATAEYKAPDKLYEDKDFFDSTNFETGRIQIESVQNFNLLIGRNGKIQTRNDEKIQGNLDIKVMGNMRISVQDKENNAPSVTNVVDNKIIPDQPENIKGLHVYSYENIRMKTVSGDFDLEVKGDIRQTSEGSNHTKAGPLIIEQAGIIHMNGPSAAPAQTAEIADRIKSLPLKENILTDRTLEWAKTKYIVLEKKLKSIMRRIPMHEPWPLHENRAPGQLTPESTDREQE